MLFHQTLAEEDYNVRLIYITLIAKACRCIEMVYVLLKSAHDGIPVWLACFKVVRSKPTDKMLQDSANKGSAIAKFISVVFKVLWKRTYVEVIAFSTPITPA